MAKAKGRWFRSAVRSSWLRGKPGMVPMVSSDMQVTAIPEEICKMVYEEYESSFSAPYDPVPVTYDEVMDEQGGFPIGWVIGALADIVERQREELRLQKTPDEDLICGCGHRYGSHRDGVYTDYKICTVHGCFCTMKIPNYG